MLEHAIKTERLLLRPLRVSDVDAFVDLHADPQVNRFVGTYSHHQALERLTAIERQWAERGHGLCAIGLKPNGEFIGRSGLQYWEQFDEVELGWTLRTDHWGHGYATEAAQACLDWGFAHLDAEYFTALVRPGNEASVKAAERLGSRRVERTSCTAARSRCTPWGDRPICPRRNAGSVRVLGTR
ncbi:GNAT family N-acetyltransferase [Streptomyces sp. NRRL B-3229]|uniref:GNAT family N-acetyltransferase n=1 Tax=Streptomyces sp. NRRL B-3229 TaxID=1463836 RepID=UPI000AB3FA75|nr:GNAT family N-acetyltransferase [Streptomyces sp. NRRL B-3229]